MLSKREKKSSNHDVPTPLFRIVDAKWHPPNIFLCLSGGETSSVRFSTAAISSACCSALNWLPQPLWYTNLIAGRVQSISGFQLSPESSIQRELAAAGAAPSQVRLHPSRGFRQTCRIGVGMLRVKALIKQHYV